jgi:hypothetical protein
MKFVENVGADRVVELAREGLWKHGRLDIVTPTLSLFAFAALMNQLETLEKCRLVLPPDGAALELLGTAADRSARNRLETRWLARRCAQWLDRTVELRRAYGAIPQGAFVFRDIHAQPTLALMGSLSSRTPKAALFGSATTTRDQAARRSGGRTGPSSSCGAARPGTSRES